MDMFLFNQDMDLVAVTLEATRMLRLHGNHRRYKSAREGCAAVDVCFDTKNHPWTYLGILREWRK